MPRHDDGHSEFEVNTWIALVRGIGAKTHKIMPLKSLAQSLTEAGFTNVKSVLATGNFVFQSELESVEIADIINGAIATYDLDNPVFLRTPGQIGDALAVNPFPSAAQERANHLLVHFTHADISSQAEENFSDWDGPEESHFERREFYIFFKEGVGTSKLSPAKIERLVGQSSTARNWNTLRKLTNAADALESSDS